MAKRPKTKLPRRGGSVRPVERPDHVDRGPRGPKRQTGSDIAGDRPRPATKLPRR